MDTLLSKVETVEVTSLQQQYNLVTPENCVVLCEQGLTFPARSGLPKPCASHDRLGGDRMVRIAASVLLISGKQRPVRSRSGIDAFSLCGHYEHFRRGKFAQYWENLLCLNTRPAVQAAAAIGAVAQPAVSQQRRFEFVSKVLDALSEP
jgi:hypothetical protein